jgi:hypothetical protein
MVAVSMIALVVAAGMVLDFGLVRMDRQTAKSASDSAAAAGLQGLDTGDGRPHPFVGACAALAYFTANRPDVADDLSGSWTRGDGSAVAGDPCATGALDSVVCNATNKATWAVYEGSSSDPRVSIAIKSGYDLSDGGFPEESLSSLSGDGSLKGGCDQLAVIVTSTRSPGLGSLATSSDLVTRVRSVGRVVIGEEGKVAVALVVLEREDCQALQVDGSNAKIHVLGNGESPGMIQVDSDGTDCSSSETVINVNSMTNLGAIIAKEAESADPASGAKRAGAIGVYGLHAGTINAAKASVDTNRVYAEPKPPGHGPESRDLVSRKPVHDDYATGVTNAMTAANSAWASPAATKTVSGTDCTGSAPPGPLNTAGTWYFDCDLVEYNNDVSLTQATSVVIRGRLSIKSGRYFALPRATSVYVNRPSSGSTPGINVQGQFRMHTMDSDGSTACSAVPTPAVRARLVIGSGSIDSSGSTPLFRVCDTTVIMMGGQTNGCFPADSSQAPQDTTLCTNAHLKLAGNAATDWSAPDLVAAGRTQADQDDLEDLALWTESEDESSIAGGGGMTLSGVFSLPNADPFNIGGGGVQNIRDSQYFTRKLIVRGNGTLEMRPNPYNVTSVPFLDDFGLVR